MTELVVAGPCIVCMLRSNTKRHAMSVVLHVFLPALTGKAAQIRKSSRMVLSNNALRIRDLVATILYLFELYRFFTVYRSIILFCLVTRSSVLPPFFRIYNMRIV